MPADYQGIPVGYSNLDTSLQALINGKYDKTGGILTGNIIFGEYDKGIYFKTFEGITPAIHSEEEHINIDNDLWILPPANGIVHKDRVNVNWYRQKMSSGVLGVEVV
jgi:hypothetical protein